MNKLLIEKAEKLLQNCKVCSVSSVTEEGYPRITIMMPLLSKGIKEFYFSTSTSSHKVNHYKKNDKAGVTFFNGGDSVTLIGKMEIVEDKEMKEKLWKDFLIKHFPNGVKDSEYCILKFVSFETTIYIEDQFETFAI